MDRTRELLRQAQAGDREAKAALAAENAGLVWSVARRFLGRGYELEDLFQIGNIGLLKCIDKFDLSLEVRFSTYAVPMILGEIKRFLRDDGLLKVSRPLKETATKARYLRQSLTQKNGVEPTVRELAQAMGIALEDLVLSLEASREVESIQAQVFQGDGKAVFVLDRLKSREEGGELVDQILLREIIGGLPPKERRLIVLRYFQDKTQAQVAAELGISQVQVSRLEKKILNGIREQFGK